MSMAVSIYASILSLIFIYLSVLVIKGRRKEKTALGSGNFRILEQRIRAHGNFAEYTPIFLILLFITETQEMSPILVHGFGSLYLIGRISHIYGVVFYEKYEGEKLITTTKYRAIGMVCTFASIGLLAITNLASYVLKL